MRKAQVRPGDISAVRERIQRIVGRDSVPPVLSRPVREDCALQALAEMHLTDQQLIKILISGVEADCNARTFTGRLEHENLIRSRRDALKFSIGEIKEFLNQTSTPPGDPLSGYVCVDDEDKRRYSQLL